MRQAPAYRMCVCWSQPWHVEVFVPLAKLPQSSCSSSSLKRAVVLTQQSQSELVLGIVATASRQIFHWPFLYASLQIPRGDFGSLLETLFAEHDPLFLRVQSPQQMKRRSRNLAVGKCCLQKSGLKKRLGFTLCSWIHTGG